MPIIRKGKGAVSKEAENLILGGAFIVRQRLRPKSEARHFNGDVVHIFISLGNKHPAVHFFK
jgi:hypothetical protein